MPQVKNPITVIEERDKFNYINNQHEGKKVNERKRQQIMGNICNFISQTKD